jgi:regulator of CtrA degradation
MSQTVAISPRIIEGLYHQALVLSDEVRATFALTQRLKLVASDNDLARISLSGEALRATTRMLHAVAWLLNHRAYFNGDLSEFQLRRCGHLPDTAKGSDPERFAHLAPEIQELIAAIERFYARLLRLDSDWRDHKLTLLPSGIMQPIPIAGLAG